MPRMLSRNITITNKLGLHARAAAALVKTAAAFESEINIVCCGRKVNGKSIMGIMMLAAAKGAVIELNTAGADEEQAMRAIEKLILERFGEDE